MSASGRMFALLAAISGSAILALGSGMTFFSDDWAYVQVAARGEPDAWLHPHNEHWVALPVMTIAGLVNAIGIGSYVPYLGLLVALHVAVACLVFALVRASAGVPIATVAGTFVLWFGSGFENLFWASQVGFVGAVLFGLLAMLLTNGRADGRGAVMIALLLTAALMTSGIGIVMSIAIGLEWALTARWRRFLPVLLGPAAVYGIWFALAGAAAVSTFRDPLSLEALADVPATVLHGMSIAFGGAVALPGIGSAVFIASILGGILAARRGHLHPRAVAALVAIAALYAMVALVRAQLFEGIENYTRYTYVSSILAIVGSSALIGPVHIPSRGRPRLAATGALIVWLIVGLTAEIQLLTAGREIFLARADMTRALVTVALEPNPPSGVDGSRSLVLVPSPDALREIKRRYGDPRTDALVRWSVRPIPGEVMSEARRRLVEGAPIPKSVESHRRTRPGT
jgi:hypothetical protein